MSDPIYIVSDLHLGSEFSHTAEFMSFLDTLPENAELILNGDTVTRWNHNLTNEHLDTLKRLQDESSKRKITWIRGNHDNVYTPSPAGKYTFDDSCRINGTLIRHGHEIDILRAILRPLILPVYLLYRLRQKLGRTSMPSSKFLKQIPLLYNFYNNLFVANSIFFARLRGIKTIICGHIHCAGERHHHGIQYLNTGSWVEKPFSYVKIENGNIELKEFGS